MPGSRENFASVNRGSNIFQNDDLKYYTNINNLYN